MLPLVYHPEYDLNLGDHVFPARKYRLIREALAGLPTLAPEPATEDDVRLVHTPAWTAAFLHGTLTPAQIRTLEIPWTPAIARGFLLAAGGTLLAARQALLHGLAFNIGGGFHHAFPNHGEGFCALHDVAIALRRLQSDGALTRALIIDTDVHHGNGTAAIFAGDPNVYTLSIHQFNNYPAQKPPSTVDIHLPDRVEDDEYLAALAPAVETALSTHQPQILFYIAGADPYEHDLLGGLSLTLPGLARRDELVLSRARAHRVPAIVTLAGGYAENTADTVAIHTETARIALRLLAP